MYLRVRGLGRTLRLDTRPLPRCETRQAVCSGRTPDSPPAQLCRRNNNQVTRGARPPGARKHWMSEPGSTAKYASDKVPTTYWICPDQSVCKRKIINHTLNQNRKTGAAWHCRRRSTVELPGRTSHCTASMQSTASLLGFDVCPVRLHWPLVGSRRRSGIRRAKLAAALEGRPRGTIAALTRGIANRIGLRNEPTRVRKLCLPASREDTTHANEIVVQPWRSAPAFVSLVS
jgi:hypothetical protein